MDFPTAGGPVSGVPFSFAVAASGTASATITHEQNGDLTIFLIHNLVGVHMNVHASFVDLNGLYPDPHNDLRVPQGPNGVSHLLFYRDYTNTMLG